MSKLQPDFNYDYEYDNEEEKEVDDDDDDDEEYEMQPEKCTIPCITFPEVKVDDYVSIKRQLQEAFEPEEAFQIIMQLISQGRI